MFAWFQIALMRNAKIDITTVVNMALDVTVTDKTDASTLMQLWLMVMKK